VANKTIDLDSFKTHDELNPKVWGDDGKIVPEIRERLLEIALDFIKFVGIEVHPLDITLTGSLANYNYSKYSDFDLHLILDFGQVDENEELVKELMLAKKSVWNAEHEISIKGFEVEMYAQNVSEPHHSTGVYSVMYERWVTKAAPDAPQLDLEAVREKAQEMMDLIDHALSTDCDPRCLESYRAKIKRMRQSGLDKGGEYSVENLAFKALRRNDYIGKLMDAIRDNKSEELTMERDA
jgi:DNA-binding Lrp family transcriptional regulator